MKKLILGALILLASATSVFAQYKEAKDIYNNAVDLIHNKQWQEGADLLATAANMDITPDFKATCYSSIATLYRDSICNKEKSIEYFTKACNLYDNIINMKTDSLDISIVYAEAGLAAYCDSAKQYTEAIQHYDRAIGVIHHLSDNRIRAIDMEGNDLLLLYSTLRLGRAIEYGNSMDFDNAEIAYDENIADFRSLQLSNDSDLVISGYTFGAMAICNKLGMLTDKKKDIPASLAACDEMGKILSEGLNHTNETVREAIAMHAPFYLHTMAGAYLLADDYNNAIKCVNDALSWPSAEVWKPMLLNTRGEICLKAGDENEARKCWEQVKELVPFFYDSEKGDYPLRDKFGK